MGGRGSSSGIAGSRDISPFSAKISYNAAKKNPNSGVFDLKRDRTIERAIRNNDAGFIDSLETASDSGKAMNYLRERLDEADRKIRRLDSPDSLRKNPDLYNERKNTMSLLNAATEKYNRLRDVSDYGRRNVEIKNTTTTYDRARKRRKSQFDDWFFGRKGH